MCTGSRALQYSAVEGDNEEIDRLLRTLRKYLKPYARASAHVAEADARMGTTQLRQRLARAQAAVSVPFVQNPTTWRTR